MRGPIRSREATLSRADGVVFLFVLNRKTTPASRQRRLRNIFLIARPPLLAVMQGGESAAPTHFDILFTAPQTAPAVYIVIFLFALLPLP